MNDMKLQAECLALLAILNSSQGRLSPEACARIEKFSQLMHSIDPRIEQIKFEEDSAK